VTLDLGPLVSSELNQSILDLHDKIRNDPFQGLLDVVVSYSALTIIYDPYRLKGAEKMVVSSSEWVKQYLKKSWEGTKDTIPHLYAHHQVPVCYDWEEGSDLLHLAQEKKITPQELINWHCTPVYRIYLVGFLPGFPYMGELPELLHCNRKSAPREVSAGSVGIAGKQTGIYPFDSPGGWHIIGKTPLKLFNKELPQPVLFSPGDEVTFYPITQEEFWNLYNQEHGRKGA
jgi:inhibitor of KinA